MAIANYTGYRCFIIWYKASKSAIKGFKKAVNENEQDADFEQKKHVEEKDTADPVATKTQSDVKEKS